MANAPSAGDLAEVAGGKGSSRDKAEAAMGHPVGSTRKALTRGKGGGVKRKTVRKPGWKLK